MLVVCDGNPHAVELDLNFIPVLALVDVVAKRKMNVADLDQVTRS